MKSLRKTMDIIALSSAIIALPAGGYLLYSVVTDSPDFDCVKITDTDKDFVRECNLGILNPGNTVTDKVELLSSAKERVSYTLHFKIDSDPSSLAEHLYFSLAIDNEEKWSGYLFKTASEEHSYQGKLDIDEKEELLFSYTLDEGLTTEENCPLDFSLLLEAENIPDMKK